MKPPPVATTYPEQHEAPDTVGVRGSVSGQAVSG
jgi:hypothetical protein